MVPRSDVLLIGAGEFFDSCPKCGHPELESRAPGVIDAVLVKLLGI